MASHWRDYRTTEERDLSNHFSMWGSDCIQRVGRKWDSLVPNMPLFRTKREAYEALSRFVCEMIPLRCQERMGL